MKLLYMYIIYDMAENMDITWQAGSKIKYLHFGNGIFGSSHVHDISTFIQWECGRVNGSVAQFSFSQLEQIKVKLL